jgi:hypothetical protein
MIGSNENKSGLIQVLFSGNIDPDLDTDANELPDAWEGAVFSETTR